MMFNAKAVIRKRILVTKAYVWKYASTVINFFIFISFVNIRIRIRLNINTETRIPLELHNFIIYVRNLCKMSALRVVDQFSEAVLVVI